MYSEDQRWEAAAQCRAALVTSAMQMGLSRPDAEDVASEAILRAAAKTDLDIKTVHAWLRVVTRRLAIDAYRARPTPTVLSRLAHADVVAEWPQDRVDDIAEANWMHQQFTALPESQRQVLLMRSQGHTPSDIADHLNCSYKTIESLTSRARTRLRATLAATLGWIAGLILASRRSVAAALPAVVLVAAVCTVTAPVRVPDHGAAGVSPPEILTKTRATAAISGSAVTQLKTDYRAPDVNPSRSEARHRPRPTTVVPGTSIGAASYTGATQSRRDEDRTLVQSVGDCIERGIDLTPEHIGCRTAL